MPHHFYRAGVYKKCTYLWIRIQIFLQVYITITSFKLSTLVWAMSCWIRSVFRRRIESKFCSRVWFILQNRTEQGVFPWTLAIHFRSHRSKIKRYTAPLLDGFRNTITARLSYPHPQLVGGLNIVRPAVATCSQILAVEWATSIWRVAWAANKLVAHTRSDFCDFSWQQLDGKKENMQEKRRPIAQKIPTATC